jgi:hypothetical protein
MLSLRCGIIPPLIDFIPLTNLVQMKILAIKIACVINVADTALNPAKKAEHEYDLSKLDD